MNPTFIAIVSVTVVVILMVAIKIIVGRVLHAKDKNGIDTKSKASDSPHREKL